MASLGIAQAEGRRKVVLSEKSRRSMARTESIITRETFQFFKDLGRHNPKEGMDANPARYQAAIVQPFRCLLEEIAPAVLALGLRFYNSGRTGPNFSPINRHIRFLN